MKTILTAFLLLVSPAFAEELLFSQLKDGEKAQVKLRSSGCFHDVTYHFEVLRKNGIHRFVQYKTAWRFTKGGRAVRKKIIAGNVVLSSEDIAGLDKLLEYYRKEKSGWCTSRSQLHVLFRYGNGTGREETLTDYSGGTELGTPAGVLSFYQLMDRFPEKTGD